MLDSKYFDAKTIKQAIKTLKPNNELFEIRIIQSIFQFPEHQVSG